MKRIIITLAILITICAALLYAYFEQKRRMPWRWESPRSIPAFASDAPIILIDWGFRDRESALLLRSAKNTFSVVTNFHYNSGAFIYEIIVAPELVTIMQSENEPNQMIFQIHTGSDGVYTCNVSSVNWKPVAFRDWEIIRGVLTK